jgi:hypothetical protein
MFFHQASGLTKCTRQLPLVVTPSKITAFSCRYPSLRYMQVGVPRIDSAAAQVNLFRTSPCLKSGLYKMSKFRLQKLKLSMFSVDCFLVDMPGRDLTADWSLNEEIWLCRFCRLGYCFKYSFVDDLRSAPRQDIGWAWTFWKSRLASIPKAMYGMYITWH